MPPRQYDSGTFEHMTPGLIVTTTNSRPCHPAVQEIARFIVSTGVSSITLGAADVKATVCAGTTEHKGLLPDLLHQAHCLAKHVSIPSRSSSISVQRQGMRQTAHGALTCIPSNDVRQCVPQNLLGICLLLGHVANNSTSLLLISGEPTSICHCVTCACAQ